MNDENLNFLNLFNQNRAPVEGNHEYSTFKFYISKYSTLSQ